MSNIISVLRDYGMSYTTIAKVAGTTVMKVKAARKDLDLISPERLALMERLGRHFSVFMDYDEKTQIDPVAFFEDHILICDKEDGSGKAWAYIHELWISGCIDDIRLAEMTASTSPGDAYFMDDLLEDYPLEYTAVRMPDGAKSIVMDIPLERADFSKKPSLVL